MFKTQSRVCFNLRIALSLIITFFVCAPKDAKAFEWGFHILQKEEIEILIDYQKEHELGTIHVTVPYSVKDTDKQGWNRFFSLANKHQITPIVRLVSYFEDGAWTRPSRREIVDSASFLSSLFWPGKRYVVLYNEPNHAAEWGGQIDPEDYAERAFFAAQWFQTEPHDYQVMLAGLDLAAADTATTMQSQEFVRRMMTAKPDLAQEVDAIASHSYPNPGFSSSAYRVGKDSLYGFLHELIEYSQYGMEGLPVYITETGWVDTGSTRPYFERYYQYASQEIWDHPQLQAITLFVTKGMQGPFAAFSLMDEENKPTPQMEAVLKAMRLGS